MRILLLLLLFTNTAFAQNDPPPATEEKTYEIFDVAKAPTFPGGEQAMLKFLSEHIKYPVLARENNIQGTVALTFVVDKNGSVSDVLVVKDIGGGCGKESMRVVKSMPKWSPGEANGKPVKVRYTLPVRFKLDDETEGPAAIVRQLDSATVWKGVKTVAEQVFRGETLTPAFKLKDKQKRKELVMILENQFQINIGEDEIKSFKRAKDLADYIFRAQGGATFFSKNNFQGKVERLSGERSECKEGGNCLNFIGSLAVPKGWRVTLFNQPKFKGERLVIDASKEEVRIASFFKIDFSETVSTTNKAVNWREETRSLRIVKVEK